MRFQEIYCTFLRNKEFENNFKIFLYVEARTNGSNHEAAGVSNNEITRPKLRA